MRLLDRLVLGEVAAATAAATGGGVFVLSAGNIVRQIAGEVAAGRMTAAQALELVALVMPGVVPYALPLGVLTGILIALGRLGSQNEITAMRAGGVSLGRIAAPILILAGALAAGAGFINLEVAPRANTAYRDLLRGAAERNPVAAIVPGELCRAFPGAVLRAGGRDGERLTDLALWRVDAQGRITQSLHAREAVARLVDDEAGGRRLVIEARDVRIDRRPGTEARASTFVQLERAETVIPLGAAQEGRRKLRWLTTAELLDASRDGWGVADGAPEAEIERSRLEARRQLHAHLAGAAAILALGLLAIPLSLRVGRSETLVNAGVGLGVALGHYLLTAAAGWVPSEAAPPAILAWTPTLIVAAAGLWLFRRSAAR